MIMSIGEVTRPHRPGRRRRVILLMHEARALLAVAGPIILSQLGGVGMNTMDTIMVGPLGAEALGAAGLASSLHVVLLMVTTGTILGMGPLVSQAFGAHDLGECRRVLVQGAWLAVALSVPVIAFNLVGEPVAIALGQEAGVSRLVGGYMSALAWGVVPVLLFMSFRQFLEGMGLAKPAMVITFLGLAVNFVGNRVLIYGVEGWVEPMGVVGSGWSTTLVRWAMLAAMAAYLFLHPDLHPFRGTHWAPARALMRRIMAIGAPAGAQIGLEVGLFSFAAVMMGWFGALELGTHQVTISIVSTTFMVALGVSLAGSIRVGQHVGAHNPAGVRRATLLTYLLALVAMGIFALIFLTIPEALLGLFSRDPEIIALGRSLLFMAALFQLFDGAQVAGFCVLRGASDTRVPMILAALSYWVIGVPAAYILAFLLGVGPVGIWGGLCVALAAASLMLLHRVRLILLPGRRSPAPRLAPL
ncbi:MATE family efflux transporter [soil metagenome]